MLPFIITGLVTGAVYGLAGIGLVLTYKTSGIFNFAHGALATIAAYVFYSLYVTEEVAWPVAAGIAIFVVGPVVAIAFELLARRLAGAALATQVAATVGVLLAVASIVVLLYGLLETRTVPVFLAEGSTKIGDTSVQYADLITFGIAITATVILSVVLRYARLGAAMRAVVDDPELVSLGGMNPTRVRRAAWLIGVMLASASGVLLAPLLPLEPVLLTLLIVQAFGAAALGAFRSLPLTFAGGLAIGVLSSLSTKWFTTGVLAGIPPAVPFIVLFVVLLVFPRRHLVERSRVVPRMSAEWTAPTSLRIGGGLATLAFLAAVPSFAGIHLADWTTAVGTTIVFLSLGLLVRLSGQVSLCHVAFAAIGVCAFSTLTVDEGLPWVVALVAAGLIAVPIGALLAIPAMRLTGLYLALATFGFGVALYYVLYSQDIMFGSTGAGISVPRPAGFDGDEAYYYLLLALATLATLFVVALGRSRLGRLLRAMADSPTALTTTGTAVNVTRLLVFCLSAFMAAVGGALIGAGQGTVTAGSYGPLLSLVFFTLIVISVGREPWSALLPALALIVIPSYLTGTDTQYWLQLAFGLAAILYAIVPDAARRPPRLLTDAVDRAFRRGPEAAPGDGDARARGTLAPDVLPPDPTGEPRGLEVHDLVVRFGGVVAVDGISLAAPTGRITGLIGPNGAGKTTTFNACSGLVRPASGRIVLDGRDVTRAGPSSRARRGLGRTFQRMELFDSATVLENVALGYEGGLAGPNPAGHLLAIRGERRRADRRAWEALELCGIAALAGTPAAALSTGQRRLVELARCLAGTAHVLLLDEPSSGLDGPETQRFGEVLLHVVQERGTGILLVEHDMSLVMDVCRHIHVLDFGCALFEGSPAEVRASPVVRAAYLGDVEAQDAIAGDELVGPGEER